MGINLFAKNKTDVNRDNLSSVINFNWSIIDYFKEK